MGLERLLENTPEAYYWIGLLFADGYVNHERNSICLTLDQKDKDLIEQFSIFINCNLNKNTCVKDYDGYKYNSTMYRTDVMDVNVVPRIISKFDFRSKKTYNPPNNLIITDDNLFLAFFCGYIDGDGSFNVNKTTGTVTMRVECQESWKSCLDNWFNRAIKVYGPKVLNMKRLPSAKKSKDGQVSIQLSDWKFLIYLRDKADSMQIPILRRKWDRIKVHKHDKEAIYERRNHILALHKSGKAIKDISVMVNMNRSYVSTIISGKRLKEKFFLKL